MSESAQWLVTGAGGQLGRSLLALAPRHGIQALGRTSSELDVVDAASVGAALDDVEPQVVLNCAAYTAVDRCEEQAAAAARVNARGPAVLAEACRDRALLVHLSTDYVFDGSASRPIDEAAPAAPLCAYGRTKLEGEMAVREAGGEHLIVRTQWLFGPGPNFVRSILGVAAQGRELRVVEDQIGRPTWTGALASALFAAVAARARGTLHLACEGVASWYDLAREAVREGARRGLCREASITPIPTSEMPRPAARPAYAVLDLARARKLGVVLPHWRNALANYLDAEDGGRDA